MNAWGIGPLLIAFGIGYQLCYQIESKAESGCKPMAHHERNLSRTNNNQSLFMP